MVNPVKLVTVVPKFTTVLPIIDPELSKLEFGIADKPNVKVLGPDVAAIAKPCPDDEANAKLAVADDANNSTPFADAVAYPFA